MFIFYTYETTSEAARAAVIAFKNSMEFDLSDFEERKQIKNYYMLVNKVNRTLTNTKNI